MNVLMPCAGLYKRFPVDGMPKYLRPLNDMRPVFLWALESVNWKDANVYFAIREDNETQWHASEVIKKFVPQAQILVLEKSTQGPAHTVYAMIKGLNVQGGFIVKDCDCAWKPRYGWTMENSVAMAWRETAVGDRGSKSWLKIARDSENMNWIESIEEKKSPTDWYSCGGYQFSCCSDFCKAFEEILKDNPEQEIFCSHVIQKMLYQGHEFLGIECVDLQDWGTWDKYVSWRAQRKVYFIDIDGVITTAGAPYGRTFWEEVTVLSGVAEKLQALKKAGCVIYLVTARTNEVLPKTVRILEEAHVPYDRIICDVPNGPRVMINDYADSNPYPAAEAINTRRNTDDWLKMVR